MINLEKKRLNSFTMADFSPEDKVRGWMEGALRLLRLVDMTLLRVR